MKLNRTLHTAAVDLGTGSADLFALAIDVVGLTEAQIEAAAARMYDQWDRKIRSSFRPSVAGKMLAVATSAFRQRLAELSIHPPGGAPVDPSKIVM